MENRSYEASGFAKLLRTVQSVFRRRRDADSLPEGKKCTNIRPRRGHAGVSTSSADRISSTTKKSVAPGFEVRNQNVRTARPMSVPYGHMAPLAVTSWAPPLRRTSTSKRALTYERERERARKRGLFLHNLGLRFWRNEDPALEPRRDGARTSLSSCKCVYIKGPPASLHLSHSLHLTVDPLWSLRLNNTRESLCYQSQPL